jgi:hypothetical protein
MSRLARPGLALVPTLLLLAAAPPGRAQVLGRLETPDLRLVYTKGGESFLVPHAGRTFENSMRFQRRMFDYRPSQKVTVLLTDFADSGNAGAAAVPRNFLGIQIAPLSFAFETIPANERMNTIMNHELVHVVTMDQAAGTDRFFRTAFSGKVMPTAAQPESILYFYLTTPRVATPRWYLEGSAVFFDTWMAGGIGRAQSPWDEMVFRSMVRDHSRFYDPLGLVSEGVKVDFQVQVQSYLYGGRFMSYLALAHSPEHVARWVERKDGSKAYYASQFREVFGVSLEQAWRDWVAWEREFQRKNLETIREHPTTPARDIGTRALGSVSRTHRSRDGRQLYAAFNYPGTVAHVGALSLADGGIRKLADIKGPSIYTVTSLAHDPETDTLFYTTDNNAFRDIVLLEPGTGKSRVLQKDARIGDLVFNRADRSIWGVRHLGGICTLVRIPYPWTEWKRVRSWPYGDILYDLDLSPDGKLLSASVGEITGRNTLRVFETERLARDDATPLGEQEFAGFIPSNFVFSDDGRFLYGSSFYTGVSNVFRYELATKALEAVTNAETGLFRPLPLGGDRLAVFRYTGEGFVPAEIEARPLADVSAVTLLGQQIAEKHPVVREWKVGSPADVPLDSLVVRKDDYHPARSLMLESAYPIVQGFKDSVAFGARVNFSDPVQLYRAHLSASFSPSPDLPGSQELHLEAALSRPGWTATALYNPADFYDLFGPTLRGRKGYAFGLAHNRMFVYDPPRQVDLTVDATYWGGLDTLPNYQNVAAPVSTLLSVTARLRGRNVRSSLGHVDDEKGIEWTSVVDQSLVQGKGYFRTWAGVDLGAALPLGHSSLWLRSSAGISPGDPAQPYSNFFFGGFGNNWVDHGNEKRYREQYAFPGKPLNDVSGRNYVRTMAEWNLPPLRFRHAGKPGFFLTWARTAVFASALATNLDDSALRREVTNVGGQVDLQLTVLSALDMTISAGYARAFEDGRKPSDEVMVSLKVLR